MQGRFSDQPDREHGNPLKPVRTRDDVDMTWPEGSISFDSFDFSVNPQIWRHDQNRHHRILYNLA